MIELQAIVSGQVQGVRYRDFVQQAATELGLVGKTYNQDNGTVLVIAHGMPDTLKEFVEYLHEGSLLSRVDGVAVEWRSVSGIYHDFSIMNQV